MTKVVLDVSMSLDGFIAGSNDEIEPLHDWLFGGDVPSRYSDDLKPIGNGRDILDEAIDTLGASVSGRRTYEVSKGWGGKPLFGRPHFVVSHHPPPEGAEAFTFVDGVESAIEQAAAAGGGKDVGLLGASVAQQVLRAGLLDEIQLHVVPVLLGRGIRLFEERGEQVALETTRVLESPGVTHVRFRVGK